MPYSELIKNFGRIREYVREFYVYGFKSRENFSMKSARSYDDERRRVESWLGDFVGSCRTAEGKNVFLDIDSRVVSRNPLYHAWKAKSFTDGDVTLHFILFDILADYETALPLLEIMEKIDRYLAAFRDPKTFDESTVRKKLKEYVAEGILETEKRGKALLYRRAATVPLPDENVLDLFSEIAPCGVIGSFLLDKTDAREAPFVFKHHYITQALDSEILCSLFCAMHEKRRVEIESVNRNTGAKSRNAVVPLRIFISVQNGRQYLLAYNLRLKRMKPYRLDNILTVVANECFEKFDALRKTLDGMLPRMWGVSMRGRGNGKEHVEFTVRYGEDEEYIHRRLEREKRCGRVEKIDEHTSRFSADVYDAEEMIPWIRTFICRIVSLEFSDKELETRFKNDLRATYALYGEDE